MKSADFPTVKRACRFPKKFIQLAEQYYHLDPVRLAEALVYNFTCNPPRDLILVADTDKSDDERNLERKRGR